MPRAICAALPLALAAAAAPGCAENESQLFIVGVMKLEASDCILDPDADAPLLTGGVLDRALRNGYRGGLLIGSQLTERGSREQLRTETARLTLRGAEVRLETVGGAALAEYTTVGTGFANPSSDTEPGYGAMAVDIVPAGAPLSDGLILARIRVFGETLGGQEIESNEYFFPIEVCNGCLISYPIEAAAEDLAPGEPFRCSQTPVEAGSIAQQPVCVVGQDVTVPCTTCSASTPACADPCQNCWARPFLDCSGRPEPSCG